MRPHCFVLTEAFSCRLDLAYFSGKISKNRLVCKNAVALAYYGSCRLLVMGSCECLPLLFTLGCGCCSVELFKIGGNKDISHSAALLRSRNFFTWLEFVLYWTPSGDSTTTLLPDLSTIRYVSGLKAGVNLFFRSCLNNTVSSSFTSVSQAEHLSSAYSFPFSLALLSLSRTSSWSSTGNSSIPGMRVHSFLRNRSPALFVFFFAGMCLTVKP